MAAPFIQEHPQHVDCGCENFEFEPFDFSEEAVNNIVNPHYPENENNSGNNQPNN